jgi:hypothetical protein
MTKIKETLRSVAFWSVTRLIFDQDITDGISCHLEKPIPGFGSRTVGIIVERNDSSDIFKDGGWFSISSGDAVRFPPK